MRRIPRGKTRTVLIAFIMMLSGFLAFGTPFGQGMDAYAEDAANWGTIAAAVESAAAGSTVVINLTTDIVSEGTIEIEGKTLIINGDKTIYSKAGRETYDSMFKVGAGGKLEINEGVTLSGKTDNGEGSQTCPDEQVYTSEKFTGSVNKDTNTYDPKGFFIQVGAGGSATLNGTISDFVTSRDKATTPRYVAPVVAYGKNAVFDLGSTGVIMNNLVGYIVDDAKANNDAQTIKQYIKGQGPNVPRVPNAATQKANSAAFDGRPRQTNAGIDGGAPGTGITATAGAIIYKDGAKGNISGTIDNNRGDTGGIMSSGAGTLVTILQDTLVTRNVGAQFGGGSTVEQGGGIRMIAGTMSRNVAWFGGGAVFATQNGVDWLQGRMSGDDMLKPNFEGRKDGEFLMEGGELTENTAFTRGGAILADSDGVNIQKGKLIYNMGRMLGGAMYVMGDHPKYEYTVQMTGLYVHDNASVSGEDETWSATAPNSQILTDKWGSSWKSLNAPMQTLLKAPTPCGDVPEDILSDDPPVTGGSAKGNTDDWLDGTGAQGTGGGVWLCAYGNTVFDANSPDEVVITNNWATGAPGEPFDPTGAYHKTLQGSDLADAKNNSAKSESSRSGITGGSDFHADTGGRGTVVINGLTAAQWKNENTNEKYESTVSNGRLNLVNQKTDPNQMSDGAIKVEVYGNLSRHGGGLAADGTYIFGTAKDEATPSASLRVKKEWVGETNKEAVTIRVKAETDKGTVTLADVPLDGVANPPETEFDATEELAPDGNIWNGKCAFPITVDTQGGPARLYTLVYTGDTISATGFNVEADMEIDPMSIRGKAALGAIIKAEKQDYVKVLFGTPAAYVDDHADPKKIVKDKGEYKMIPISLFFEELKKDKSGNLVNSADYVFLPGEISLEDLEYEISATDHYKTEYNPVTGQIVETTELLYSIYLFEIPITAPMSNDNWPLTEKYVNKQVHSDIINFDQEFVYDIMAYVPASATEFTISDTLVDGLEFADKNGDPITDPTRVKDVVQTIYMKMANNHKPGSDGTVASDAVLRTVNGNPIDFIAFDNGWPNQGYLPDISVEGNKLTVKFDKEKMHPDVFGKWIPGRWVQVTFMARIKDEYRTIEGLKKTNAEDEDKPTSWNEDDTDKRGSNPHNVIYANGDLGLVEGLKDEVGKDPIIWAVEGPSRLFARSKNGHYYATDMNDKEGNTWKLLDTSSDDWKNADNRYNGRPPEADNTRRSIELTETLLSALEDHPKVIGYELIKGAEGGSRLFIQAEDPAGETHIFTTPDGDKTGGTWFEITEEDGEVYNNAKARLEPDRYTIRMLDLETESIALNKDSKNWPVISEEKHEGMANQALYNVKFGNEAEGTYKTNTVTIKPETTKLNVNKKWNNGGKNKWPGEIESVTFGVYAKVLDDKGKPIEKDVYVDANGDFAGLYKEGDNIPDGAEKLTVTIKKGESKALSKALPKLKGTTYFAREIMMNGKDIDSFDDITGTDSSKYEKSQYNALAKKTGDDEPVRGAEDDERLYAMTAAGEYWSTKDLSGESGWEKLSPPADSSDDSEGAQLYRKTADIFDTKTPGMETYELKKVFTALNTRAVTEKDKDKDKGNKADEENPKNKSVGTGDTTTLALALILLTLAVLLGTLILLRRKFLQRQQ